MTKSTLAGKFADRLRSSREERELSQSDLARLTGLQPSAIAHFEAERRKPSFDNIRVLAAALKVTTDYLLGSEGKSAMAFKDEHKLSKTDRDRIQDIINVMVKDKK
ncbi:MAG: helix-turn-helix transcriptional regulator [Alphaproteobacteria bacterium]|nr:helix-turn-helix transcriptional regulator [Alphaproteobacteria bacterium]